MITDSATRLLEALHGTAAASFTELRMIDPAFGPPRQEWFGTTEHSAAAIRAAELSTKYDVYFGVAPRTRREGGKAAIAHAYTVWGDVDTPAALAEMATFDLPPSAVVASGSPGCFHAYWFLDQPITVDVLEAVNRRLATHLGADIRATDAARILRVPGTLNHKGTDPRSVVMQSFTGERYDIEQVLAALPHAGDPSSPPARAPRAPGQHPGEVSKSVTKVLDRLDGVIPSTTGWTARCPAHDDTRPSLSVGQGDDAGVCCTASPAARRSTCWPHWTSPWLTCTPRPQPGHPPATAC
jgi:hypothetical protein